MATVLGPAAFLVLGVAAFSWAKDSMTKTALNRRFAASAGAYLLAQCVMAGVCLHAGLPPHLVHLMSIFGWTLVYGLIAIWGERAFTVVAITCGVSLVVAGLVPGLLFPLMSLDNLVFTIALTRTWLPREDVERFREKGRQMIDETF